MILDLDATTRNEIAAMVYTRWSKACDAIKQVKTATWEQNKVVCPKGDWEGQQKLMLEDAQKELDLAAKLKADICPFSLIIKGE
jgi:hypothetical protein